MKFVPGVFIGGRVTMFGFKRERHKFDNQDREHAELMKAAKKEMQRIEIENLRSEIRALRKGAMRGRPQASKASSLLKDFQDLDALRDYLSPEQEQQADEMGGLMPLILSLIQGQQGAKGVPETPTALQEALKQQAKGQKKGGTKKKSPSDTTSLVLDRLPLPIRSGIASGKIPKSAARAYGHKLADREIDKIYKILQKKQ